MERSSWAESTFIAWENQGGNCDICGKHIFLNEKGKETRMVGHHIHNRSKGGDNSVENCKARHAECEVYAHQLSKDGNP